ncbi:LysR family transcriptional regulator [Celerinatantimonas yamalensis]|uniref:LysR family transcriptional regulator n=1 Tax=Celerinatantimonas yamalensis TaxID=559956 RepID=A0ABW9G521_9GAMM
MKQINNEHLWEHLYWLTILAEQQSFTRAAERLDVSKSAMSQKIKELETLAGVALVQRTTRSVRLTEAGQELVNDLTTPFAQITQSFLAICDSSGPVRGLVRMTAPVAFARQHLIALISKFLKIYPQVRVQLEVTDRIISLAAEGFDIAVRHCQKIPDTYVAQSLCTTRTMLVASPTYLQQHGLPEHPSELIHYDCLYYPRGSKLPSWRFQHNHHTEIQIAVDVSALFATNNSESIRDAAIEDLGIAMLPDFSAKAAVLAGTLVEVLPQWQIIDEFAHQIWIIRPYSAKVPRVVTVFTRWLRAQFELKNQSTVRDD